MAEKMSFSIWLSNIDDIMIEQVKADLYNVLSNCSSHTKNCISSVGLKRFVKRYLYADDRVLFGITNLGKESQAEIVSQKPLLKQIVNKLYDNNEEQGGLYEFLSDKIKYHLSYVSNRVKNYVEKDTKSFIDDYVLTYGDIYSIKGMGQKSFPELEKLVAILKANINEYTNLSEKQRELLPLKSHFGDVWSDYIERFFKEKEHLPMFHILSVYIKDLIRFERNYKIMNLRTPLFRNQTKKDKNSIAEEYGLSVERVRQITERYGRSFFTKKGLLFVEHPLLFDEDLWTYVLDEIRGDSFIDSESFSSFEEEEKTGLKEESIIKWIHNFCSNDYDILGFDSHYLETKDWKRTFLVRKDITRAFNFILFRQIVKDYLNSCKIEIHLKIRDLLNEEVFEPAWIDFSFEEKEDIEETADYILYSEFDLIPNEQGYYTIRGEKKPDTSDLIFNYLVQKGKPCSFDEVRNYLADVWHIEYTCKESLFINIRKDERLVYGFVNDERKVSLKEWNNVQALIIDLIVDCLNECDKPLSNADIYKYVSKYRSIPITSINTFITNHSSKFVKFNKPLAELRSIGKNTNQILYGLKNKKYDKKYYVVKDYFHQVLEEFVSFINTYKRFPSENMEEQNDSWLYNWWLRIRIGESGTDQERKELQEVVNKYPDYPKNKVDYLWNIRLEEFIEYIKTHHSKPKESTDAKLYKWMIKCKADLEMGLLTDFQKKRISQYSKELSLY